MLREAALNPGGYVYEIDAGYDCEGAVPPLRYERPPWPDTSRISAYLGLDLVMSRHEH